MKLHERYDLFETASIEAADQFFYLMRKHHLTEWEALKILQELMGRVIKWGLRGERHPDDPEKKADEE